MYKYVVFGLGRVGTCAAYDLIKNCEAESVSVYEPSVGARRKALGKLKTLLGPEFDKISVQDGPGLYEVPLDVVLSCAPYKENYTIACRAAAMDIPYCDLGGNPGVVSQLETIESETPIVPDCGISPGISNIFAADMARKGYKRVRVRCGGLADAFCGIHEGLRYKMVFSPEGLVSEYGGEAYVIEFGEIKTYPTIVAGPPHHYEWEKFEGSHLEAAYTSNNSMQMVEYLKSLGVENYDYKTLRRPGHWAMVQGWKHAGYLVGDKDKDAELVRRLSQDESLRMGEDGRDFLILSVKGYSDFGNTGGLTFGSSVNLRVEYDVETKFTAMEQTTAWGIATVAHFLAKRPGEVLGFSTPERFMPAAWVQQQLEKRLKQDK